MARIERLYYEAPIRETLASTADLRPGDHAVLTYRDGSVISGTVDRNHVDGNGGIKDAHDTSNGKIWETWLFSPDGGVVKIERLRSGTD